MTVGNPGRLVMEPATALLEGRNATHYQKANRCANGVKVHDVVYLSVLFKKYSFSSIQHRRKITYARMIEEIVSEVHDNVYY